MKNVDLEYLCRVIGNLAGIPVRIYRNGVRSYYFSTVELPEDPIKPYIERIGEIKENVGYFMTPYFNYYGIVNSGTTSVVIGPSRQTDMAEKDMRALAFECDVTSRRIGAFIDGMRGLVKMPLGSVIQILCTMNYVLNGEKLSLEDVSIYDLEQTNISSLIAEERLERSYKSELETAPEVHNTLAIEESLMNMVARGDTASLSEWLSNAQSVRGGVIALDGLRQVKNTFIVTATLTSRAAIKGGLSAEESLSLSDNYIKKCELMTSVDQIVNLQYHMVLDYTERVASIRIGDSSGGILTDVANYVRKHISDTVSVKELADSLFISRTHLSARFKKECGMTLTDYILMEKIEEAKRLLQYTNKSLTVIGQYLAFSSQSHFTRVFKRYTGLTPREYKLSLKH